MQGVRMKKYMDFFYYAKYIEYLIDIYQAFSFTIFINLWAEDYIVDARMLSNVETRPDPLLPT